LIKSFFCRLGFVVDPTSARDRVSHSCRLLHGLALDKELHVAVSAMLLVKHKIIG